MGIRNLVDDINPWFIKKLNSHLMSGAAISPPIGHFRPSMFSMCKDIDDMCLREMLYNYLGKVTEATFDIASIRRMIAGTAHHQMWEQVFRDAGIIVHPGCLMRIKGDDVYAFDKDKNLFVRVRQDKGANYPNIHGTCDFQIAEDEKSELELIEWKSGNYKGIKFGHIMQWQLYSIMLDINNGWIVIENRDNAEPKPFKVKRDNKLVRVLFDRMRLIEEYSAKKKVFSQDNRCLSKEWTPKDCAQYNLCFSDNGDIPWT